LSQGIMPGLLLINPELDFAGLNNRLVKQIQNLEQQYMKVDHMNPIHCRYIL
jgi:hypothetical protein